MNRLTERRTSRSKSPILNYRLAEGAQISELQDRLAEKFNRCKMQ
jgi:hypothetical protein